MEIRRILKVLAARWWVIALIAVVGGVIGTIAAGDYNDGIRPRWKAEAPVTFIQLEEDSEQRATDSRQTGSDSTGTSSVDVDSERSRAQLLLTETLTANPRLSIQADRARNLLLFIAIGRDGEETLEQALALRDEYQALGATVLSIDQIEATMATLLVDINQLKKQVVDLEAPEVEEEDPSVVAQRAALASEIERIENRQASLAIWLVNPELRPTEDEFEGTDAEAVRTSPQPSEDEEVVEPLIVTVETLEAEKLSNAVVLRRLQVELGRLPAPPQQEELGGEAALELEALNLDLAQLETQYIDLLRRRDGRPPGGFFEEPVVSDETSLERSKRLLGLFGMLAGGLTASGIVIGLDRVRRPVWNAADLEGIVSLGVVNRDRTDGLTDRVWYPASLSQRRRDIQTLRAATDAVTEEQSAIIGFFGVGVASNEVGEVAADLAAAYTVAEREVLLFDGNSFHPNTLPEFGSESGELDDLLMTQLPRDDATRAINRLLDETSPVIPFLTALGVEAGTHDPIDAFASPNCKLLMDVAKSRYDVIVVAGPDVADTLSDAVVRRVDFVVLVGYVGYTKVSDFAAASVVLADRRAELAGVVLLEGRREALRSQIDGWWNRYSGTPTEPHASPDQETSDLEAADVEGADAESLTVVVDDSEPDVDSVNPPDQPARAKKSKSSSRQSN